MARKMKRSEVLTALQTTERFLATMAGHDKRQSLQVNWIKENIFFPQTKNLLKSH